MALIILAARILLCVMDPSGIGASPLVLSVIRLSVVTNLKLFWDPLLIFFKYGILNSTTF